MAPYLFPTLRFVELRIGELKAERHKLIEQVEKQDLTPEEVSRMSSEREQLRRTLEDLRTRVMEAQRGSWEREIASSKRSETVDTAVSEYLQLAYRTGIHPSPPEPYQDIDFNIELHLAASNPQDMMTADIRGTIKPALLKIAEFTRIERANINDEKIRLDHDLDRLTNECDNLREELQTRDVQLDVLLRQAEDIKDVSFHVLVHSLLRGTTLTLVFTQRAADETSASNSEASKLEREVGLIQTSVQQSELAMKSRLSALEVELRHLNTSPE